MIFQMFTIFLFHKTSKAIVLRCSMKEVFSKLICKIHRKKPVGLILKEVTAQVFPGSFENKIFKNMFLIENLRTTISEIYIAIYLICFVHITLVMKVKTVRKIFPSKSESPRILKDSHNR